MYNNNFISHFPIIFITVLIEFILKLFCLGGIHVMMSFEENGFGSEGLYNLVFYMFHNQIGHTGSQWGSHSCRLQHLFKTIYVCVNLAHFDAVEKFLFIQRGMYADAGPFCYKPVYILPNFHCHLLLLLNSLEPLYIVNSFSKI